MSTTDIQDLNSALWLEVTMRQETGSRGLIKTKDVISVRIHQNGDAFVLPEVHIAAEGVASADKTLCVELITKRVMLIPTSIFDVDPSLSREDIIRRECAAAALVVGDNEELLTIGEGDVVAVAPLSRSLIEELKGRQTGELIFDTPLLRGRQSDAAHVILDSIDGLSAVKVYSDGELRFADVFETNNVEQIVYWLTRLSDAMSLRQYDVYVVRGSIAPLLLSSHFKNVVLCE